MAAHVVTVQPSQLEHLQGLLKGGGDTLLREPEDLEEPYIMCEVISRWWTISFANKNARKLSRREWSFLNNSTICLPDDVIVNAVLGNAVLQAPEPHFWGVFQPLCGAKVLPLPF